MGIIVSSNELNEVLKSGLAKVKDSQTIIHFKKGSLFVTFSGSAVRYQQRIAGEGKSLDAVEFDATLLAKLIAAYKGEVELLLDGPELKVKRGRSSVKVACVKANAPMIDSDAQSESVSEDGLYQGWVKQHPLNSAHSLRRALQSIKDNITKTELIVEVEWGKSDLLKVKIVDQFHGILAEVKLEEKPSKNKVRIRVPLSAFLLMLDVKGDLYVDNHRVMIKGDNQLLECRFITGSAYGTIDDMVKLIEGTKATLVCEAKELISVVKRIQLVAESDDIIRMSMAKKALAIDAATVKATVREVLSSEGTLPEVALQPKNLQDVASTLSGKVAIGLAGRSLIFKSKNKDITINGAIVVITDGD